MAPWTNLRQPKTYILFLDTGDICRCPMAKGIFSKLLADEGITHVEIMTAGVMTTASILPTQETRLLLTEAGIDIGRYRSTQYTEAMLARADLVLGMSPFHVQKAKRLALDARNKTHLLKEYTRTDPKNVQIPDPMGATLEVYRRVFRDIRKACEKLMEMDIVRKPKSNEGDGFTSTRTRPTRQLEKTGRKVVAPTESRAYINEQKKELKARLEAESIGFPVADTQVEVSSTLALGEAEAPAPRKAATPAKPAARSDKPAPAEPADKAPKKGDKPASRPAKGGADEKPAPDAGEAARKPAASAAKEAPAKKSAPPAPKKSAETKPAAKKGTEKKAAAKKPATRKAPPAKKTDAKKTAARKSDAKKAAPTKKPAPARKAAPKKAARPKKAAPKKAAPAKKAGPAKKADAKKAARPAPARKAAKPSPAKARRAAPRGRR